MLPVGRDLGFRDLGFRVSAGVFRASRNNTIM